MIGFSTLYTGICEQQVSAAKTETEIHSFINHLKSSKDSTEAKYKINHCMYCLYNYHFWDLSRIAADSLKSVSNDTHMPKRVVRQIVHV